MTITFGTSTDFSHQPNASSPQTQSITVASGVELLIVVITIFDTSASDGLVSGVTWNGENLASSFVDYHTTTDGHISVWWLALPVAATANVSVAFGGTVTDFMASAVQVQGTVGSFAEDVVGSLVVASGSPTAAVTPVASATFAISAMLDDQADGTKVNDDGNSTEIYKTDVGTDTVGASYDILSGTSEKIFIWTDDDADEDYIMRAVTFAEIAASMEFTQNEAGALSFVGAITEKTEKKEAGALTFAGSQIRKTLKNLAGALTFSGALARLTKIGEAGALTFAGAHAGLRFFFNAIAGALTFVGSRTAKTLKVFSGVLTFVGVRITKTLKSFAGSLTFAGAHTKTIIFFNAMAGALTFVGTHSLAVTFGNAVAGVLTFVGAINRKTLKLSAGSLTFAGALASIRTAFNTISGSLSFAGGNVRKTLKLSAGSLSFSGGLVRKTLKAISGALSFAGSLATNFMGAGGTEYFNTITGALTFDGSLTKKVKKAFAGALTFVGALIGGHQTLGDRTTKLWVLPTRTLTHVLPTRTTTHILPIRTLTHVLPVLEGN